MELLARIRATADADPLRVAYRDARDGRAQMYRELAHAIDRRRAAAARFGGGAVVLVTTNDIDAPATILGLLAAGVDVLLTIPTSTRHELDELAARVDARAVLRVDEVGEAEAAPRSASPGTLLLTSSGSTGVPKIIRRSTPSIDAVSANMAEAVGMTAADHVLAAVPLAHSYGIEHGLLAPLWAGATVTLSNGLDLPAITAALARGDVTVFPTVPAVLERLVESNDAIAGLSRLRALYSAGARLPDSVRQKCVERLGLSPGQIYGSTEIGSVTYLEDARSAPDGNVGRPMRGVSVRVIDLDDASRDAAAGAVGEIAVRAPSMFDRYHDGEPAALVDGHFLTGDLGRVEADGSLTITGRSKLLIDTGGPKVDPLEVERVLETHPAVASCVVVPLRQSETVFRLRAIVVPRAGVPRPAAEEIRAFALERLAPHKVPRVVEFRDDLPRSAAGKVARKLLEES